MEIDPEDVRRTARLARIHLDDAEIPALARAMGDLLTHMQGMAALDLAGVEPLLHPEAGASTLRPDEPAPSLPRETALSNAPARDEGFFKVPRVMG